MTSQHPQRMDYPPFPQVWFLAWTLLLPKKFRAESMMRNVRVIIRMVVILQEGCIKTLRIRILLSISRTALMLTRITRLQLRLSQPLLRTMSAKADSRLQLYR